MIEVKRAKKKKTPEKTKQRGQNKSKSGRYDKSKAWPSLIVIGIIKKMTNGDGQIQIMVEEGAGRLQLHMLGDLVNEI